MARLRRIAILAALGAAAAAAVRRVHGGVTGRPSPGGILMPNPDMYDRLSGWLFRPLFGSVAADVAAMAVPGARVLEVGCGPGHLSVRLAVEHGLDVTGLDLDPQMIARARANAAAASLVGRPVPTFLEGDVAQLPFPDQSFHLVVSTFSMHHWTDPVAGLTEINRVLRPDGRAIIWDLRHGFRLFHGHAPDPFAPVRASPLELVDARPWRWPWRLALAQRFDLKRLSEVSEDSARS